MSVPSRPRRNTWQPLSLAQLQRVKNWQMEQHGANPVEYEVWEAVVTLWVMGLIGWLPAFAFEAPWAYPLCGLGIFMPRLYVYWRARAHAAGRLRCDWLDRLA
ncbi:MAG: hypothetical protein ABIQ90_10595 [Polaromonas sp.]